MILDSKLKILISLIKILMEPKSYPIRNKTFVETKEKLVINTDCFGSYCFGYYDDETQETLPLTEDKKKYAESLNIKIV